MEIIELLKREYLFQGMSDEQVAWIADKFRTVTLERNTIVYSEGAPGDCFYMVFRGRVRVIRRVKHQDQMLNILTPGDFFGEEALLYNVPRTSTIRTIDRSILLRMDRENFDLMLRHYPEMRTTLVATAESRRMARTKRFDWLNDDEAIYFLTRKHDFFLLRVLVLPILMVVLSFPVFSFALYEVNASFLRGLSIAFGVLLLGGGLLWALWRYVDWGNDYFMVTSQRVVWTEKMVALYDSRREAPLDTILAVNVISSQLGRWIDYGNVNVRTFTGGIMMRNVNHPIKFASFIEGFRQRAAVISKDVEIRAVDEAIRKALERQRLGMLEEPVVVPEEPPPYPEKQQKEQVQPELTFTEWVQNILKVRYVQGNTITYRKHWFMLVRNIWLPVLLLALTFGVIFGIPVSKLVWGESILPTSVSLILSATVLPILLGWLLYQYLDWSNDIYRLTPEQIFDIEKKPLGEESKKSAPLESILSLEHERANLLGILLNLGNVVINVGQTKFDFIGVYNPDQVHQDIADYREALNRRKKAKEAEREREKMAVWFVSYHMQTSEEGEDLSDDERFSRFQGKIG